MKKRLHSIDALRGLAMFLILAIDIGGAPVFRTFTELWGENFAKAAAAQFSYGFTDQLRLCHIAMPMFLFIVGVVIPLSVGNRLKKSGKKGIYLHIVRRSVILFVLGLIAGGHLLQLKFDNMPLYNNVLEYISIGYLACALLITVGTPFRVLVSLTVFLLVLYWALFLFIPVPGWEGNPFSGEMNLAIYVDNVVLGRFHKPGSWQVLATINFISNMLLGVLMGKIIFGERENMSKVRYLFMAGLIMLAAGIIWGQFFPVIRSLWTSSYVLVTCGISTMLLALFYFVIDIRGYRKWAFFFIVFGVNSIAIYMMAHMFDFRLIGNIFVGGLSSLFPSNIANFIQALGAMAVMWLIMYWMYRKRTFIKI